MKRKAKAQPAIPKIYCSECAHFKRDTEGISRSRITGEYFIGICLCGLHPDTMRKQFADKPRDCSSYMRYSQQKKEQWNK